MAQLCNREEIGRHLDVAANKINNANCSKFNELHDALKELSLLILKKDAAFKQQDSTIKFNTYNGTVETNYFQIMDKIKIFLRSIDTKISEADDEDDKKMFTERKKKYESVKKLLDDATTEDEVRKIINGNQVKFDSGIIILSGGTRKRKTTRRKRAKTLKNKKKVGKRK